MTRVMKGIRYSVASALVLTGLAAIPLTVSFGKDPITDTITQAKVNICLNAFTSCTNQCSVQATSAPGSYSVCMQNCSAQYSRCMNAIARYAPNSKPTLSPRPSIAPPKPTPRKTQPDRTQEPTTIKSVPNTSTVVKPTPTAGPKKK